MKQQAFYITGTTYEEYVQWCKENNKAPYKYATKRDFFARIRSGRLCRDNLTGKLVVKRAKSK